MEVGADEAAFESLPIFKHKVSLVVSPVWHPAICNFLAILIKSQIHTLIVLEELAFSEEEFWYELLVIRQQAQAILPTHMDVVEYFIRWTTNRFILEFEDV